MIIAWKNGLRSEFSERSWELMVDKNGWMKEAPAENPDGIPVEVEEIMAGNVVEEVKDYESMTYIQLKALCKELGIKLTGYPKKVELISILNDHTE